MAKLKRHLRFDKRPRTWLDWVWIGYLTLLTAAGYLVAAWWFARGKITMDGVIEFACCIGIFLVAGEACLAVMVLVSPLLTRGYLLRALGWLFVFEAFLLGLPLWYALGSHLGLVQIDLLDEPLLTWLIAGLGGLIALAMAREENRPDRESHKQVRRSQLEARLVKRRWRWPRLVTWTAPIWAPLAVPVVLVVAAPAAIAMTFGAFTSFVLIIVIGYPCCIVGERRRTKALRASSRIIPWEQAEASLERETGTLIVLPYPVGGPDEVWWTSEPLLAAYPQYALPTYREWLQRKPDERPKPTQRIALRQSTRWAYERFINQERGAALLVEEPRDGWNAILPNLPERLVVVAAS